MMRSTVMAVTAALMLAGLQSCFSVRNSANFTYSKVSPAAYDSLLKASDDHYLIDVRTPGEYNKSHMPGARNYDFFAFHYGADVDTLQRGKTTFVYCQTCHRSPFAARIMKHKGFCHVYDLRGGYAAWQKAFETEQK
ncbi:MAG: rhodanese-like domain-containing protein [Bacteroidetes bacterium]|nr:rhodanese-like domain-containing protein [Bacteroidota bacterium]